MIVSTQNLYPLPFIVYLTFSLYFSLNFLINNYGILRKNISFNEKIDININQSNVKSYIYWDNPNVLMNLTCMEKQSNITLVNQSQFQIMNISQTMIEICNYHALLQFSNDTQIEILTLPNNMCKDFSFYGTTDSYLNHRIKFKEEVEDLCIFYPLSLSSSLDMKIDVTNFFTYIKFYQVLDKIQQSNLCSQTHCQLSQINNPFFIRIQSLPSRTLISGHFSCENEKKRYDNSTNFTFRTVSRIIDRKIVRLDPLMKLFETNGLNPAIDINFSKYMILSDVWFTVLVVLLICIISGCCKPGLCRSKNIMKYSTDIINIDVESSESEDNTQAEPENSNQIIVKEDLNFQNET